jgi:hypothetical protein
LQNLVKLSEQALTHLVAFLLSLLRILLRLLRLGGE